MAGTDRLLSPTIRRRQCTVLAIQLPPLHVLREKSGYRQVRIEVADKPVFRERPTRVFSTHELRDRRA